MKENIIRRLTQGLLLASSGALTACPLEAAELNLFGTNMPPLDFHGFVSQGFLYSGNYNYLADDTKNGSFQFTEFGLNVSMNPFPRTRIAVQGFDFDVGNVGQYHPFLDYALLEYTVNDEVGLRAGRIRRPGGIYNDIQDIDLARTFVLLPQGMYDARWRDWSANLDGGELFGSIPLGKVGSLAYAAFAGMVNMPDNGGVARYVLNSWDAGVAGADFGSIDSTPIFGGQLWYNPPIDGLRFGAAFSYADNFSYTIGIPYSHLGIPAPGTTPFHAFGGVPIQQYSAEYLWKNWTFQAEFYTYNANGDYQARDFPVSGKTYDHPETWYVAASYRFNKYLEAGAYYTQFHQLAPQAIPAQSRQNDAALSLRVDLKSWWTVKVEGHVITGTALLRDNANNPPASQNNDPWFMLAIKTTVSF
jgi:hypothetical protein